MTYLYITSGLELIIVDKYPDSVYGSIDIYHNSEIINVLFGLKLLLNKHVENIINKYLADRLLKHRVIYDCPLYPFIDNTTHKIYCTDVSCYTVYTNMIHLYTDDD
jgi:hypothetical protein